MTASVIAIANQDSTSSRLLPGSSYSCCIRNLQALVHKQPVTGPGSDQHCMPVALLHGFLPPTVVLVTQSAYSDLT
jgi:hypothetical protein